MLLVGCQDRPGALLRGFCVVFYSLSAVRMVYLTKLLYLEELYYRHLRLPVASGHWHLKNLHFWGGVFLIHILFCHFISVLHHKTFSSKIHSQMSCSNVVLSLTVVIFHSLGLEMESDEWLQCFFNNMSHSGVFYKGSQFSLL